MRRLVKMAEPREKYIEFAIYYFQILFSLINLDTAKTLNFFVLNVIDILKVFFVAWRFGCFASPLASAHGIMIKDRFQSLTHNFKHF